MDNNPEISNPGTPFNKIQPISCAWRGCFNYQRNPEKPHEMFLELIFSNATVMGQGVDEYNFFNIFGAYIDQDINFQKQYPSHVVNYAGKIINPKRIRGTWIINPKWTGTFEMWVDRNGQLNDAEIAKLAKQLKSRESLIARGSETKQRKSL